MNALSLRDVSFTYVGGRRPALSNLSLDIPDGQICGVVGRMGSGKTTLCALCTGFIPHFYDGRLSGSASVDGQDVVAQPVGALVRHVGLVSSNPFSQISGARFSVFEEVAFGLENLGLPRDEIVERVTWALDAMQLTELRDRSPFALSGGQQQRMVIATTIALRPPVLVLDEPTAQLDPLATQELAEVLRGLARTGTTILFAEHNLEWVADLAERVVVLDAGSLIADGTAPQILADPLLLERGVGWPRPALLAERARAAGLWPGARPLPVTLGALVEGLAAGRRGDGAGAETAPAQPPNRPTAPSSGGQPIIQLENVTFSYPSGVQALRGVSLTIGAGERVALLGRNGAGKSTLVRHTNGLLRPSSGRALVAGVETRATTVARCARHVGIVFQDIRNQLFARTVRDELRFGPRNLGHSPAQVEALVDHAIEALDLADAAGEHPYDLPPARRRLVAIAAVLAMDPAVLVLDEPTAGLDAASVALLASLAAEQARRGKSVLVVTHDLDFCFENLGRIVLVREGLIALDAPADSIDGQTRALLAAEVGLPLGLHAVEALALPDGDPLARLLTPAPPHVGEPPAAS